MTQEARESKDPNGYSIFFNEDKAGRFKPRAVLVDTEPLACESILTGEHKKLYSHNQFVTGTEEASFWSRGSDTLGQLLIDSIMDKVRV